MTDITLGRCQRNHLWQHRKICWSLPFEDSLKRLKTSVRARRSSTPARIPGEGVTPMPRRPSLPAVGKRTSSTPLTCDVPG